jgi:hypothetical protein
MHTTTPNLIDTTVTAEDAPLGVCLWPVLGEQYASNFTLERVETVRSASGTRIHWVYESGKDRWFQPGEKVAVRVDPDHWPTEAILAIPVQATSAHHADGAATRPTSAVRTPHLTDTQLAYLKWYATGNIGHTNGYKGTVGTSRRLQRLGLVEASDQNPFYRATEAGRQWLIGRGWGRLLGVNS